MSSTESADKHSRRRKSQQSSSSYSSSSYSSESRCSSAEPETEIEVRNLSSRVKMRHLERIFSLYGSSLKRVRRNPSDPRKALVIYGRGVDARDAVNHLEKRGRNVTVIDGRDVDVRLVRRHRSRSPKRHQKQEYPPRYSHRR